MLIEALKLWKDRSGFSQLQLWASLMEPYNESLVWILKVLLRICYPTEPLPILEPDYISKFTSEVFTGRLYFIPRLYLVLMCFFYLRHLKI